MAPYTGQTAWQNPQREHWRTCSRYFFAKLYLDSISLLLRSEGQRDKDAKAQSGKTSSYVSSLSLCSSVPSVAFRDKGAKVQRHKAEKPFCSVPLCLCIFVPFYVPLCLCPYLHLSLCPSAPLPLPSVNLLIRTLSIRSISLVIS